MNPFDQVSQELSDMLERRANQRAIVETNTTALDSIELKTIPADGWPGKNPDERKLSERRALAASEEYQWMVGVLMSYKDDLRQTEAVVDGLQARQRGYEFIVRDEMNRVLGGRTLEDILHDAAMADMATALDKDVEGELEAEHNIAPVEGEEALSSLPVASGDVPSDDLEMPF